MSQIIEQDVTVQDITEGKLLETYLVADDGRAGHVELYVETAETDGEGSTIPLTFDEARRLHEALGAMLYAARKAGLDG